MGTNLEVLEAEALKLAPSDRSHLLERLIVSLDLDPEVEAACEREATDGRACWIPVLWQKSLELKH